MWLYSPDRAARRQPPQDNTLLVYLQGGAQSPAALRRAIICAGQDAVRFLRIDSCPGNGPVRALLCVERAAAPALREEILRRLPGCEWHEANRRERSHEH